MKSRSSGESMAHFVCKYKVQEPIEEPNLEEFGNGYKKGIKGYVDKGTIEGYMDAFWWKSNDGHCWTTLQLKVSDRGLGVHIEVTIYMDQRLNGEELPKTL